MQVVRETPDLGARRRSKPTEGVYLLLPAARLGAVQDGQEHGFIRRWMPL
jgi:hypothetical protein